jgi:hypothetical protein
LYGFFVVFFLLVPAFQWAHSMAQVPDQPSSRLERAYGLPVPQDMETAVTRVRDQTPPGTSIYVVKPNMEQGWTNDILFYFLADRVCAAYDQIMGQPMDAVHSAEARAALRRPDLSAVVFSAGPQQGFGDTPLDRELRAFNRKGEGVGSYLILYRR